MSHMLDCRLYGLDAGGHHLTSVLLHAVAAMLLFLVLRNLTGALWRSAFVATVFAIHPLRVESVAWVAERKDVLSGLFFMLTLLAYARYAQKRSKAEGRGAKPNTAILTPAPGLAAPDYVLALVFFTLGLLSKPMLVTLPFVLLLLDYWPLNRFAPQAKLHVSTPPLLWLLLEKIPFLLLSAASCVVTILSQKEAMPSLQYLDFPSRAGNALVAYAAYIGDMLYPVELSVFYPHPVNLAIWQVVLSLLILLILSAGVLAVRRKHPCLLVGWLWYLGMLVPVIGLLQVGNQARADRYTYLPQIGLYMMVAWGSAQLCSGWRYCRAVLGTAAGAILTGLLASAYVQTGYWKDSIALWTHTIACTSENYVAHNDFADALLAQGKLKEAIVHFERALQLSPDYADAHNNLGIALVRQGKLPEAIEHYRRALRLKPDFAEAHNNLGIALVRQGELPEAIDHYERALRLKPDYADAHYNLGIALARQKKLPEAIERYERSLQLSPDYADVHNNLGNALAEQGKLPEAIDHYERALRLKPDYAEAHNNLGNALAGQGKLPDAIDHYEQALRLKPDYAKAHSNAGDALLRLGKSSEALTHFQQALNLATAQNNTALAEFIRTQLKSCQPALHQPKTP
jgi:tetratricopeptide (TPR) repeat protein